MCTDMNTGTMVTISTGSLTQAPGEWCYNDIAANCTTYGGLYEWASAMNLATYNTTFFKSTASLGFSTETCNPCAPTTGHGGYTGICPSGAHIPSAMEWAQYTYCLKYISS